MESPMTTQPISRPNTTGNIAWMEVPVGNFSCPPGLEYLTQIDQLLVHQKVEILEAMVGFETANKYIIKNSMGQPVYFVAEDTDWCKRSCCGTMRAFDMKILDNNMQEIIHIYRPLRCIGCCYPCCMQEIQVMAPPGTIIGFVKQRWTLWMPEFDIQNAAGDTVLRLKGPCITCRGCRDVNFPIYTGNGESRIGNISKQWAGLAREVFTKADHFGISFPMDLDVNIKAVLLGALFLIDFLHFEENNGFLSSLSFA